MSIVHSYLRLRIFTLVLHMLVLLISSEKSPPSNQPHRRNIPASVHNGGSTGKRWRDLLDYVGDEKMRTGLNERTATSNGVIDSRQLETGKHNSAVNGYQALLCTGTQCRYANEHDSSSIRESERKRRNHSTLNRKNKSQHKRRHERKSKQHRGSHHRQWLRRKHRVSSHFGASMEAESEKLSISGHVETVRFNNSRQAEKWNLNSMRKARLQDAQHSKHSRLQKAEQKHYPKILLKVSKTSHLISNPIENISTIQTQSESTKSMNKVKLKLFSQEENHLYLETMHYYDLYLMVLNQNEHEFALQAGDFNPDSAVHEDAKSYANDKPQADSWWNIFAGKEDEDVTEKDSKRDQHTAGQPKVTPVPVVETTSYKSTSLGVMNKGSEPSLRKEFHTKPRGKYKESKPATSALPTHGSITGSLGTVEETVILSKESKPSLKSGETGEVDSDGSTKIISMHKPDKLHIIDTIPSTAETTDSVLETREMHTQKPEIDFKIPDNFDTTKITSTTLVASRPLKKHIVTSLTHAELYHEPTIDSESEIGMLHRPLVIDPKKHQTTTSKSIASFVNWKSPPGVRRLEERIHGPQIFPHIQTAMVTIENIVSLFDNRISQVFDQYDFIFNSTHNLIWSDIRVDIGKLIDMNDDVYTTVMELEDFTRSSYRYAHNKPIHPGHITLPTVTFLENHHSDERIVSEFQAAKSLQKKASYFDRKSQTVSRHLSRVRASMADMQKHQCMRALGYVSNCTALRLKYHFFESPIQRKMIYYKESMSAAHEALWWAQNKTSIAALQLNDLHLETQRNHAVFKHYKQLKKTITQKPVHPTIPYSSKTTTTPPPVLTLSPRELEEIKSWIYKANRHSEKLKELRDHQVSDLKAKLHRLKSAQKKLMNTCRDADLLLSHKQSLHLEQEKPLEGLLDVCHSVVYTHDVYVTERTVKHLKDVIMRLNTILRQISLKVGLIAKQPKRCRDLELGSGDDGLVDEEDCLDEIDDDNNGDDNIEGSGDDMPITENILTEDFSMFLSSENETDSDFVFDGGVMLRSKKFEEIGRLLELYAGDSSSRSFDLRSKARNVIGKVNYVTDRLNRMEDISMGLTEAKILLHNWRSKKPAYNEKHIRIIDTAHTVNKLYNATQRIQIDVSATLKHRLEEARKHAEIAPEPQGSELEAHVQIDDVQKSVDDAQENVKSLLYLQATASDKCRTRLQRIQDLRSNLTELRKKIAHARILASSLQVSISLSGSSYIDAHVENHGVGSQTPISTIEVCIKPAAENGIILLVPSKESYGLKLQLSSAMLEVIITDQSGYEIGRLTSGQSMKTGSWYTVSIARYGQKFVLTVREKTSQLSASSVEGSQTTTVISDLLPFQPVIDRMYVGGMESSFFSHSTDYAGCLSNLRINGVLIDLLNVISAKSNAQPELCTDNCVPVSTSSSFIFEGHGFLEYPASFLPFGPRQSFSLQFRSLSRASSIIAAFSLEKENLAALIYLEAGSVVAVLSDAGRVIGWSTNRGSFADGKFHSLTVMVHHRNLRLTIDGQTLFSAIRSSITITFPSRWTGITLGGITPNMVINKQISPFSGCMQTIVINGSAVSLISTTHAAGVYQGTCQKSLHFNCATFTTSSKPISLPEYAAVNMLYISFKSVMPRAGLLGYNKGRTLSLSVMLSSDGVSVTNIASGEHDMIAISDVLNGSWHHLTLTDKQNRIIVTVDEKTSKSFAYGIENLDIDSITHPSFSPAITQPPKHHLTTHYPDKYLVISRTPRVRRTTIRQTTVTTKITTAPPTRRPRPVRRTTTQLPLKRTTKTTTTTQPRRRTTTTTTQPVKRTMTTTTTQRPVRRTTTTTTTTQRPVRRTTTTTTTTQRPVRRTTTTTTQRPVRRTTTTTTQRPVRRTTTTTTTQRPVRRTISTRRTTIAATEAPTTTSGGWIFGKRRKRSSGSDTDGVEAPVTITIGSGIHVHGRRGRQQGFVGSIAHLLVRSSVVDLSAYMSSHRLQSCTLPKRPDPYPLEPDWSPAPCDDSVLPKQPHVIT